MAAVQGSEIYLETRSLEKVVGSLGNVPLAPNSPSQMFEAVFGGQGTFPRPPNTFQSPPITYPGLQYLHSIQFRVRTNSIKVTKSAIHQSMANADTNSLQNNIFAIPSKLKKYLKPSHDAETVPAVAGALSVAGDQKSVSE
jgi:hypothetical protein